jgi:Nif-specific regulatory protein
VEEKVKLRIGEGITGWVAREGVPDLVSDVLEDSRYIMVREDIRSEMAVPLKLGQEVFGVLNLDHVKKDAFKEEDLEMLEIFGHNASISLRQAFHTEEKEEG